MTLEERIRNATREVNDFPIPNIRFKDISPVFLDPHLMQDIVQDVVQHFRKAGITKVVGIESRGFLLGPWIAAELGAGFVVVRKKGKLPPETDSVTYDLEYGSACIEMVKEAMVPGDKILIHDDLLATGGTAAAAARLAAQNGATVAGFSFIVFLQELPGIGRLTDICPDIHYLVTY